MVQAREELQQTCAALKCQAGLEHFNLEQAAILAKKSNSKYTNASIHLESILFLTVWCFYDQFNRILSVQGKLLKVYYQW